MDANDLTKEYSNGEVTIVWKNNLCIHAAQCVKNNPDVLDKLHSILIKYKDCEYY